MANKDFNLDLRMRADFKQAQAELQKAQKGIRDVVGDVNTANLRSQAMAGTLRAVAAGITTAGILAAAAMSKYIANTIESEKVQAQLVARIKDTGAAAGRSLGQLNEQATKLQNASIFDDETIGRAQAMLLTFKQVQGVNFDRTIAASLDLATVMDTDVSDAAKTLGKALSDPEKGLTQLTKAGVIFTDAEREKIKAMTEAGNVAGAQAAILDKLEGSMGTAAEAARDTLGGALQALENSFDNLLEGDSGDAGIDGTREAVESLIRTFNDPATKQGFNAMIGFLGQLANFAAQAIASVGGLAQAVKDALADNDKKSRTGLLSRRTDLEDKLFDLEGGIVDRPGKPRKYFGDAYAQMITETKQEIAQIDQLLRVQSSLRGQFDPDFRPGRRTIKHGTGQFANVLAEGEIAPAGVAAVGGDADKKRKAAKKADPDASAKQRLANLQEELALLNAIEEGEEKADEAAKARYETTQGEFKNAAPALKAQIIAAAEALDQKRAEIKLEEERKKKLEETTEAYEDLRDELRTPAEASLEEAIEQVGTLNAAIQAGIKGAAEFRSVALDKIAKGLLGDQPDFQGLAPEVGGALGELTKLDKAAAEEDKWYQDSLARLTAFRELKAENQAAADAAEEQVEAAHQERMRNIQASRQQATLSIASDFFGQLSQLQRSENSKIAAVGKAAAIAQALINTYQSATAAYSAMASIPYVGPALGAAAAAAAVAAGLVNVAQIRAQSTSYSRGGYTGPGGKFEEAGTVHKGEGVLSQEDIAALGGPSGFYALREAIQDGSMRERIYGWAGYADGGMVAPRRQLAEPDWQGMARANQQANSNHLRVYLLNNEDELAQRLAQHPAMEKAVVAIASQNGNSIRAEW